ncbi:MAG: tetratricopeptide repeat protein [Saprospiraceae bacterium]
MLPKFTLLFLMVLSFTSLFSQNSDKEKEKLIDGWCDTAYDLRYQDAKEANKIALSADSLSKLIDYKKGEAYAKIVLGILAKNIQDYDKAIGLYEKASELRKTIEDFRGVASCYNNLGNIERGRENLNKAAEYYHKGIEMMVNHQVNDKLLGTLFSNQAMIYNALGKHERAVVYIDSSMLIRTQFRDTVGMAYSKLNSGKIYGDHNFPKLAIKEYRESLALFKEKGNINGTLKCLMNIAVIEYEAGSYEKALKEYQNLLGSLDKLAKPDQYIIHKNIATILRRINNTAVDSALFHYKAAMELLDEKQHHDQADLNYHIGWLHFQEKEYEQSISYLEESYRLFDSIPALLTLPFLKRDVFYKLSENYAKTNQFEKAFFYTKQSILQQDSLMNKVKEGMNSKIEIEILKGDKALLQKENEQLSFRNNTILGGIIAALLAFGYWLNIRQERERREREKERVAREREIEREKEKAEKERVARERAQEQIEHQRKVDNLLTNQEVKVLKARLDGQDAERIRVGQDLHDRLGVMLSTIKLYFQSVEEKLDGLSVGNNAQFQKATNLLDDACDEVRKIAHDMQSSTLTHFGLQEELKELADKLKASQKIDVKVITFGMKERINNKMEFELYKMITELVGNALKHSKASSLSIGLNQFDELINIIIEDDGKGFELQQLTGIDGTGLRNIETRVLDLHGQINIDSELGRGTAVSIDIPYPKKNEL